MTPVQRRLATFVLGDIVGSTREWQARDDMAAALAALDAVVNRAAAAHDGVRPIEQGEGDSYVVVFDRVSDALAFAVAVQRAELSLDVRMAVHTGEAEQRDDGRWVGPALNRCARLRALASGGQVLVSAATSEIAVDALPPGTSLRDLGRHRLRDLTAPEHVRQICHADLPADFPPLASLDRHPNNLPVELTTFIGREQEIEELTALVMVNRLVALTGAGGSGKTRLATELAARNVHRWPDGVWLADLASTADPALVPHALATAMSMPEQPLQSMADTIAARLTDETVLVVLDNCEHLLDASSALAHHLLRSCPNVTVVATSREALSVEGEVAYRVPSLPVPEADDDLDCDAVRLFVDRAAAVRPTFALDASTAPSVVELCQRLDGLPLAIELAASRCRAMSPAEIAEQLAHRFRILTAGRRSALPRQRTLDASVRWSHDLLSDDERAVLRRLAVFAGGFTLDGAERVAAGDGIEAWHVVDLLTGLVDKSLVHVEDMDGRTRYRLLETIRVFAAEHLDQAGELAATRDRHLDHMVDLAAASDLDAYGSTSALRVIDLEIDNVRAARDWAIERGNGDAVFRLLASTSLAWEQRFPRELTGLREALEDLPGGALADRAHVLFELGWSLAFTGDVERARSVAAQVEQLAHATGDERTAGVAMYLDALLALIDGDRGSTDRFDQAIKTFRDLDDAVFLAGALHDSSLGLAGVGRLPEAIERILEARFLAREGDALWATCHATAATLLPRQGKFDEAMRSAELALGAKLRMPFIDTLASIGRAWALSAAADHDRALDAVEEAVREARRFTVPVSLAGACVLRELVRFRADAAPDFDSLAETELITSVMGAGSAMVSYFRAEYALSRGDLAAAASAAETARQQADATVFRQQDWPRSRLISARVALVGGDLRAADDLAHQALAKLVEQTQWMVVPETLELLAEVACAWESYAEAARLLGASSAMRGRMGWCPGRPNQRRLDDLEARLVAAMGGEDVAAARAAGEEMSDDEAIAYATRGRGARKRPSSGWESLTPTERDVMDRVAVGLSNKEVAAKLFMAPATVRTHLTHVFAKLGMTGRAQLIAAMAERRNPLE